MRDAEELRFKFESGKLKDVSRQPILLQSVDQLIEQGHSAHFQRFVESEKAKNDIWKEKKRFERAQQILNNVLQKQYGTKSKEINLKRRVLDLETELYGIEAAISYTKELINYVTSQRETKRKAEESLLAKYRKIQEFEKTAQRKQMMIQTLVKQNGRARNQLEVQQNELLSYVKNQITLLGKEIDSTVDEIKQKHSLELELFSSLQLAQLESVELQNGSRVPYESLSIHQQECNENNASRLVKQMIDALKVKSYLAPEELIFKIKELKEKEIESNNQRKLQVSHDEEIVYDEFIKKLARMQDQCKTMVDQTESKRRQTLSVLRGSFLNATDALKECLDLGKLTNTWWDQPAQFLVPWIKEEGMNLRQWHTQWEINSARLAEKSC
ncbi:uncharacterized protein LOC135684905 [Rhopilema esculentum]|uniref:uncharacterized protein LOC135684905 n=1 Tax=Rhopilema esculentum TaxID=499914 RepID=UPI0031DF14E1